MIIAVKQNCWSAKQKPSFIFAYLYMTQGLYYLINSPSKGTAKIASIVCVFFLSIDFSQ